MLIDYVGCVTGSYQSALRAGFELVCDRLGYDLVTVVGRALDSPLSRAAACNSVYELMSSRSVDGLILVSGGLATHSGVEGLVRLCRQYEGLALCSLGVALPGVPSVTLDNSCGMEELVEHIVSYHGCRNLAFIGGPERALDAVSRLEAGKRVLARHGRSLDPACVVHGQFTVASGAQAMRTLLGRGLEIDAVIAANDGMALGAIEVLKDRGKRTPGDVRVTGFDDSALGRFADPPLATVRQPVEAMAERAVALLVQQLAGELVPEHGELAVEFIPRASCGCALGSRVSRLPNQLASGGSVSLAELKHVAFQRTALKFGAVSEALFNAWAADLEQPGGAFLETFEACVASVPLGRETELLDALHADLQQFEAWAGPDSDRATSLASVRNWLQSARSQAQLRRAHDVEMHYHALASIAEPLSSALDRESLRQALQAEIGSIGVRSAYVLLYTDPARRELETFLGWEDGCLLEADQRFDARELLPPKARAEERRRNFIVLPLASDAKSWGILVIEPGSKPVDYGWLPDIVSSALQQIALYQEIVEKTALHQRSVQERQATAERLQALGVLAGGVAHDLNNSLGPLLALPEVMQETLSDLGLCGSEASELSHDLAVIQSATLRASRTIKDLITLGRQGRTWRSPLNLNRVVSGCLKGADSPFARGAASLRVELHPEPLVIEASESHLARAILNLAQNALESGGNSEIVVRTERLTLSAAVPAYEVIEPGDYAVFSVTDRGSGIANDILGRIFEPFFSHKALSESSGSGLGLALVHGVVKEHRGFVDVQSTLGQGTTFTLYFPRTNAACRDSVRPVAPPRGSARTLVIDDDPVQIRCARRVLTRLGYQMTSLSSGKAACELFEQTRASLGASAQSPFDLVITDVMLHEERDGIEVCERIRELFPHQRFLIVSGHASMERGAAAVARGLSWLSKPYTADELGRAVAEALQHPQLNERSPACAG